MFSYILKFIKSLNSNSHPGEIANAVSIGVILGFLPKNNAFWYILFVLFLFIRINKGSLLFFTLVFGLLAHNFDTYFDKLGYYILTLPSLVPTFKALLDIPFVAFTKLNNTIVMGSLAAGLCCYIPVYGISRVFIKFWRAFLAPAVRKTKLVTLLSKLPIIQKIGEMV
ncbi:MAG: TIGR03546 family protein [Treponema sp.]|nr:TIGR03546 family protein [Treponema sp.]